MSEDTDSVGVDAANIHSDLMDSPDWEYVLAGQLLGTDWNHPEYGADTIKNVRHKETKLQGERTKSPEVVLKYEGIRLPVSGFLRRIDPNDIADIEPANKEAERVVQFQEKHSWRQVD
jgi:hypothetical protein